jgi:DNA replication protein DnaC
MRKLNISFSEIDNVQEQNIETFKNENHVETQLANIIPKRFHGSRIGKYETPIDDLVRTFCTNGQGQVFLLSGSVGTGKSTVGFASMYERALKGLPVGEYLSARMLCPILRSKQNFNSPESEFDFIMRMGTTPYFFYDEAGKADDKEIEWAFLSKVLAIRYDNMLDSFITTNMGLGDFGAFIKHCGKGDDIYTRIKSNLITACFTGRCFRQENVIA